MTPSEDDTAVRSYLRAVVGEPVRVRDTVASTEPGFVTLAAEWAQRWGVDRRSLRALGVPKEALDDAGIVQPPVQELVRAEYDSEGFTIADLVARSCVSPSSVRSTVSDDEEAGIIERMPSPGQAHRWRRT